MKNIKILLAEQNSFDEVKKITQHTIREIYPKYYPSGAVQFFCEHHCDENIMKDILDGKVYLLQSGSQFFATVTVNNNNINSTKNFLIIILPNIENNIYKEFCTII